MREEFAYELLDNKDYIFLSANPNSYTTDKNEQRGLRAKEKLNPEKYCEIEYLCTGISDEGKIEERFLVYYCDGEIKQFNSLGKNDMQNFLEQLLEISNNLVVDFTLMNTRFLGAFCAFLCMYDWKEIYFCYTEPGNYAKNENDNFELKNTTMGFEQIPGLETLSDSATECDWVVFLGFEGSRLMRLEEESPSSRRYSLPYISIPSMRLEWHNYSLNANRQFFELKIANQENIDYVCAINPFETYQKLRELGKNNSNVRLVISPIGPKPVLLGCVMYVLENENEMLLFDNPFQESSNTKGYGMTHFYDLTEFMCKVINKRFVEED